MSDSDLPCRSDAPFGKDARAVAAVRWRGQCLVDAPRPADGYPLSWYVQAHYLGDFTALAAEALRASGALSAPTAR